MNFQKGKLAYFVIPASESDRKRPPAPVKGAGGLPLFPRGRGETRGGWRKASVCGAFLPFYPPAGHAGTHTACQHKIIRCQGETAARRDAPPLRCGSVGCAGRAVTKVYIIDENLRFELLRGNFFDIKTVII